MFQQLQFWIGDIAFQVGNFFTLGGDVLVLIALTIFLMWTLIIERATYFYFRYPKRAAMILSLWKRRTDHSSWRAHSIREALIEGMRQQTVTYVQTVKTLVAICPLLGLMGTVTGMISVFDVMASAGMGNPRLMADGVAKATVPTMAGMVGALSGVFAIYWLQWQARTRIGSLADSLETRHQQGGSA